LVHCNGAGAFLPCRIAFSAFSPLLYGDALACGCLAAFVVQQRGFYFGNVRLGIIITLTILLGTTVVIALNPDEITSSFTFLFQASLAAILIVLTIGDKDGAVGRFLNTRVAVTLGLLSYSLYVWHLMFLSYFMGDRFSAYGG
jgi:peptidoglycan/LPS O-acetylase OafA/YrhL